MDQTSLVKTYVVKSVDNVYYLSNSLMSDPVYNYVMMSYKTSLKLKVK